MDRSDSIVHLATALSEAQAAMPKAKKDQVNPFFKSKYAGLDSVMPAALEVLSSHGLSIAQMPSHIEGHSALTTVLMHTSGEFIAADQPLLLSKDDPQGQGAAITYARRYALMSAIGMVADEDDDGNAAIQNGHKAPKRAASVKSAPPSAPQAGPAQAVHTAALFDALVHRFPGEEQGKPDWNRVRPFLKEHGATEATQEGGIKISKIPPDKASRLVDLLEHGVVGEPAEEPA